MSSARIAPPAPELLLIQRWLRAQIRYAQTANGGDEAFSVTTWWASKLTRLIDQSWENPDELRRELLDAAVNAEKAANSAGAESVGQQP